MSLTIQPIAQALISPFNVWYLDDGTLGGPVGKVLDDFKILKEKCHEVGLSLNEGKCELSIISQGKTPFNKDDLNLFGKIKEVSKENLTLLGAPIGGCSITDDMLQDKVTALNNFGQCLKNLDSHAGLFLLKNSFALPRLQYVLRAAPCYNSHILKLYDAQLLEILQQILNCRLNGSARIQAGLPVNMGGLGVLNAQDAAAPSFLASVSGCRQLVTRILSNTTPDIKILDEEEKEACLFWKLRVGMENIPKDKQNEQKTWSVPTHKKSQDILLKSIDCSSDRTRLLASFAPKSGAWLNALPSSNLGFKLTDSEVRISTALRLGCNIVHPHVCKCGKPVDCKGHHGLSCSLSSGRISRHNAVNNIICRALLLFRSSRGGNHGCLGQGRLGFCN